MNCSSDWRRLSYWYIWRKKTIRIIYFRRYVRMEQTVWKTRKNYSKEIIEVASCKAAAQGPIVCHVNKQIVETEVADDRNHTARFPSSHRPRWWIVKFSTQVGVTSLSKNFVFHKTRDSFIVATFDCNLKYQDVINYNFLADFSQKLHWPFFPDSAICTSFIIIRSTVNVSSEK